MDFGYVKFSNFWVDMESGFNNSLVNFLYYFISFWLGGGAGDQAMVVFEEGYIL